MRQDRTAWQIDERYPRRPAACDPRDDLHVVHMHAPEAALLRAIERRLEQQKRLQSAANAVIDMQHSIESMFAARTVAAPRADAEMHDFVPMAEPVFVPSPEVEAQVAPFAVPRFSAPRAALIGLLTLSGAFVPVLLSNGSPRYRAETIVTIAGPTSELAQQRATLSRQLTSPQTFTGVVSKLQLDRDPEFIGEQNELALVLDILSPRERSNDPVSRAEEKLASVIKVGASNDKLTFGVDTRDAAKSLRIAEQLSDRLSSLAGSAPTAALRKDKDGAEEKMAAFIASNGEGNVKAATALQKKIEALDIELKATDDRLSEAKDASVKLKIATPDDIVATAFPSRLLSPSLQDLRGRYQAAKATIASLSADLGPRHPKLVASRAEVDDIRSAIAKELVRVQRRAEQDLKDVLAARKQIADGRSILVAQSKDTGVDLDRLSALRTEVDRARTDYGDTITTASTASGLPLLAISKPKLTTLPSSPTTPVRMGLGAAAGFLGGWLLTSLLRRRRSGRLQSPS